MAASYLDRIGGLADPLWRAVRHGREGGAVTSAIEALFLLGNDAYFTGRWDELTPLVDEGLALCEEHGYRLLRWPGLYLRALVTSARGDQTTSKSITDEMSRWAAPRRIGAVLAYTDHIKTHAALTRGDFDTAYRHATRINPADELTAQVTAVPRCARRRAVPTPRLAIAGATAMAASEHRYRACFDDALTTPRAERWPFDIGRIRLAYGERLRRTRSPAAAREHLTAALESFEQLRAQRPITRARNELRANGCRRPRRTGAN